MATSSYCQAEIGTRSMCCLMSVIKLIPSPPLSIVVSGRNALPDRSSTPATAPSSSLASYGGGVPWEQKVGIVFNPQA